MEPTTKDDKYPKEILRGEKRDGDISVLDLRLDYGAIVTEQGPGSKQKKTNSHLHFNEGGKAHGEASSLTKLTKCDIYLQKTYKICKN